MSHRQEITIGNKKIGKNHPPFIIAEVSCNHNQSLEKALEIVEKAAWAGADAVKLQTYTADTMTLNLHNPDFTIQGTVWDKMCYYDLYKKAHTPWEWHIPIFEACKKLNMICFSSPFDESAVDFLETLEIPAYKIASFENTDIPLIRKIAAQKKPTILSTGVTPLSDLAESVEKFYEAGGEELILLKCTSSYPASPKDAHVTTIPHMSQLFNVHAGLSDHTLGCGVPVASVALGGRVIEKHLTLSRANGGFDSAFSSEPEEFKTMVEEVHRAFLSLGKVTYGASGEEKKNAQFRRSLIICKNIKKGEPLTQENLRVLRPGIGMHPKYYTLALGKTVKQDVSCGTPLNWELFVD